MDRKLLNEHYVLNKVEDYHGIEHIDALRNLALNESIPPVLRTIVQQEYDAALIEMGGSRIDGFADRLYDHLNGSEPPEILDVIDSYDITIGFKDWSYTYTVRAVRVRIAYFERVKEYFANLGRPIRLTTEYECMDMVFDGKSLIEESIKRKYEDEKTSKYKSRQCHASHNLSTTPWVMNAVQWMLTTHNAFNMPYNGFRATVVPAFARDMTKGEDRPGYMGYNERTENRISYINRVFQSTRYYAGDELAKRFTIPDFYSLKREYERIEKEIKEGMKDMGWT